MKKPQMSGARESMGSSIFKDPKETLSHDRADMDSASMAQKPSNMNSSPNDSKQSKDKEKDKGVKESDAWDIPAFLRRRKR